MSRGGNQKNKVGFRSHMSYARPIVLYGGIECERRASIYQDVHNKIQKQCRLETPKAHEIPCLLELGRRPIHHGHSIYGKNDAPDGLGCIDAIRVQGMGVFNERIHGSR